MVINDELQQRGYVAGMIAANQIILEDAVKLRENGLNNHASILADTSKRIEAKINDLQHRYGLKETEALKR